MRQSTYTSIDDLMDEKETAKILNIKPNTLAVWRSTLRYDLPYVKVGRGVRYKREDVQDFIDRNSITQQ